MSGRRTATKLRPRWRALPERLRPPATTMAPCRLRCCWSAAGWRPWPAGRLTVLRLPLACYSAGRLHSPALLRRTLLTWAGRRRPPLTSIPSALSFYGALGVGLTGGCGLDRSVAVLPRQPWVGRRAQPQRRRGRRHGLVDHGQQLS